MQWSSSFSLGGTEGSGGFLSVAFSCKQCLCVKTHKNYLFSSAVVLRLLFGWYHRFRRFQGLTIFGWLRRFGFHEQCSLETSVRLPVVEIKTHPGASEPFLSPSRICFAFFAMSCFVHIFFVIATHRFQSKHVLAKTLSLQWLHKPRLAERSLHWLKQACIG